jgi:hypothetical protein
MARPRAATIIGSMFLLLPFTIFLSLHCRDSSLFVDSSDKINMTPQEQETAAETRRRSSGGEYGHIVGMLSQRHGSPSFRDVLSPRRDQSDMEEAMVSAENGNENVRRLSCARLVDPVSSC